MDLELSCLAWPLWVNKHSPDLKGSVSQFIFSVLFVHPKIGRAGRANSSEQRVCNRKAQRFLLTTGLQRDSCSPGLDSFILMLVYNSACDNWGIVRFIGDSRGRLRARDLQPDETFLSLSEENFADKWVKNGEIKRERERKALLFSYVHTAS